jgi:4a-hydroxytetrahydrobiopterin dehydratase
MTEVPVLTPEQLESALGSLPDWRVVNGKLRREYRFADFTHAIGFMAAAATQIEKMNHHPEWFNVYGRVDVDLITHSAGGITARDVRLAQTLEAIAKKLS